MMGVNPKKGLQECRGEGKTTANIFSTIGIEVLADPKFETLFLSLRMESRIGEDFIVKLLPSDFLVVRKYSFCPWWLGQELHSNNSFSEQ